MNFTENTKNWWYCDNIVHPEHNGQIGLLHMTDPMVFILIRDDNTDFRDFEDFRAHCAEVNYLTPSDRGKYNEEEILINAYNFMVLQEKKDEELYGNNYEF